MCISDRGTTTAGKGSIVCEPVAMTNGSAVAFTVGKLLDHNGQSFDLSLIHI